MPETSHDVIVCGSLHLDIMVYAADLPRPDETVVGSRWAMSCGGKGGNQAVMAARAGARVAMIGRVGGDDFGARLLANLATAGVDSSAIARDPAARSGMSVAIVRNDGEYGAVIVSEANLDTDPAAAAADWRALGGAPVLVLQNEIAEAVNIAVARAARASGARVLINAAPARAMSDDLLALVDTLIVNRVEAEMIAEETVDDTRKRDARLRQARRFASQCGRDARRGRPRRATARRRAAVHCRAQSGGGLVARGRRLFRRRARRRDRQGSRPRRSLPCGEGCGGRFRQSPARRLTSRFGRARRGAGRRFVGPSSLRWRFEPAPPAATELLRIIRKPVLNCERPTFKSE